jgi:hypothetical protein
MYKRPLVVVGILILGAVPVHIAVADTVNGAVGNGLTVMFTDVWDVQVVPETVFDALT